MWVTHFSRLMVTGLGNLQKIKCSEIFWPEVLFPLKQFNQFREFFAAAVLKCSKTKTKTKKTLPSNSFKHYSTEFAFTRLQVSQGMKMWRHSGSNDTLGWKDEFLKARALAKIYLPWYHQFTSLITLIIIVNNKIQNSLVLNYMNIGTQ